MITPDYNSLSNKLLRELCDKRKIPYPDPVSTAKLLDAIIAYDDEFAKTASRLCHAYYGTIVTDD